jgi:hypothetical protein
MNNTVNAEQLREQYAQREERLRRIRLLARALIDSGFKTLAMKLHPDKGGSTEEMAYLTEAHRIMKQAATEKLSTGDRRRECLRCGHYLGHRKRKCSSAECGADNSEQKKT